MAVIRGAPCLPHQASPGVDGHMDRVLFLALLMAASLPASAEIYKWKDKDGGTHFSDTVAGQEKVEKVDVRVVTYTHVTYQKISARDVAADPGRKRVVMYGTRWCGHCKKARSHFNARNIAYTDLDVETDPTAKIQFAAMGGGGVPVILVGDTRINGFSAAAFERIYNRK